MVYPGCSFPTDPVNNQFAVGRLQSCTYRLSPPPPPFPEMSHREIIEDEQCISKASLCEKPRESEGRKILRPNGRRKLDSTLDLPRVIKFFRRIAPVLQYQLASECTIKRHFPREDSINNSRDGLPRTYMNLTSSALSNRAELANRLNEGISGIFFRPGVFTNSRKLTRVTRVTRPLF